MAASSPKCSSCLQPMIWSAKSQMWKCFPCLFALYAVKGDTIECGAGIVVEELETPCHCGHSHYDHIGWRTHLEGEGRLRTNCRIMRCKCESYHTNSYSCHTTHRPEAT